MEKVIKSLLVIFIFFLSIGIANAEDILGIHTIEDVTYYNSSDEYPIEDYGYLIPQSILFDIYTDEVSTINVTTDTWTVEMVFTEIDTDTTRLTVNITNYTGDTTSETQDLYHLKLFTTPAIEVLFSAEGYYDTGVTVNTGWALFEYEYTDVMLYPSTWIAFESDGPVSLEYRISTVEDVQEKADEGYHPMLSLIRTIPVVGDLLADSIVSIGIVISVFISVVLFAITGWAILFLLFETFVLAHAIAAMKLSGGGIVGVTAVFTVIASDNYIMIMFVVNLFTKMFTLLVDLARTIWNLIPFI
jgi:hypothetical protein